MSVLLRSLGIYGYDSLEPIILASLVTGDPLLLIGKAGTGKTYLLNSLSEALNLAHRHYNASLIAFDDLVGFPYPEKDGEGIRYLPTPSTVWGAESMLVDEISRCKPEHQNRLFSLIQERRIQGILIESLRYRWAAMNPCSMDQGAADAYEGSLPLDQALADRFAFVVEVPDWGELSDADRDLVADPRGEGAISKDKVGLSERLQSAGALFKNLLATGFPDGLLRYAVTASTILTNSGLRISPRRVRQLARNLLGAMAVADGVVTSKLFQLVLQWSIPHRAWGKTPSEEAVRAAHISAWDLAFNSGNDAWLNTLQIERSIARKVKQLIGGTCPDADTGTLAVTRSLASLPLEEAGAFSFALYPAALAGKLPIGREGVAELARLASEITDVRGEISWKDSGFGIQSPHPDKERFAAVLAGIGGKRHDRAAQLFSWLLLKKIAVNDPETYEKEFNKCIALISSKIRSR